MPTAVVTQWSDGHGDGTGPGDWPTSSASLPSLVAGMLGDLDPRPGDRVLEIGTGTGWNAALLARRLGPDHVTTIELDRTVADKAAARLTAAGSPPRVVVGDGAHGCPDTAPHDGVLATCSVTSIPPAWLEQTRPGGRIVAPYSPLLAGGRIVRLTVSSPTRAEGRFVRPSAFMRLRGHRYSGTPADRYMNGDWPAGADRSWTRLDPADALRYDWAAALAVGLTLPDLYQRRTAYGDGWTWWLFDTAVTSWATVDAIPDTERYDVRQHGPRRLWDEIENAWDQWQKAGWPGVERYGLTVDGTTHTAWLDTPDNPLHH
ncbi:methyltransferase domain-containing protein [Streptomyces sp. SL13]|uniref:Protein-L-isoaspartate O-methyltransferase n=1 Tax=Streptantibioticus silvisoli TaxID=2705255 RepID=A0AA90H4J9_9ACTN|nr:methyltransferase domain-containing protein [Streptantibioticus silvisoli]MDI5973998.1 methyltransferase domain-containing protein [Streptantibioticus silvisoli]